MSRKPTLKEFERVVAEMLTSVCQSFIAASRGDADYAKVALIMAEQAGNMAGSLCYSNTLLLAEDRDADVSTAVATFEKAARSMEQDVAKTTADLAAALSKVADSLTNDDQPPSEAVASAVADLLKRSQ